MHNFNVEILQGKIPRIRKYIREAKLLQSFALIIARPILLVAII